MPWYACRRDAALPVSAEASDDFDHALPRDAGQTWLGSDLSLVKFGRWYSISEIRIISRSS
jgi:hypothetical protein